SGDWLVPAEDGGWLRHSDGTAVFPSGGDEFRPQFERDGFLWAIRRQVSGARVLERWNLAEGVNDPAFDPGTGWPAEPLAAVPAGDGSLWVLGGSEEAFLLPTHLGDDGNPKAVFRVGASGELDSSFPVAA